MARTKLMTCGHGSRHLSPYDGRCRRCVREAKAEGESFITVPHDCDAVDRKKLAVAQDRKLTAERNEAEAKQAREVEAINAAA